VPGPLSHALAAFALAAATWLAQAAGEAREAEPSPPAAAPAPALPAPGAPPAAPVAAVRAPRALWVLAEGSQRVLERADRLPALLEDARALGATDLFVQVYRGGRAWFDSSLADTAPWQGTWRAPDPPGEDALATLVARAHQAGLRVHAWVNVLSLAKNAQAPLLRELGGGVVLVDQWGRSLLDYPDYDVPEAERRSYRIGTPSIYLDPAAPGVAERLAATFEELLRRYPGLDGLHLDYIRYPDVLPYLPSTRFGVGLSFGYGATTRARFQAETGLVAPFADNRDHADRYDAWRREQLSGLVGRIAARARAARPGVTVSAAVFPDAERAYQGLFQDWRGWLEAGHLDVAVPMLYSTDERLFGYQVAEYACIAEAPRIWVGLGSWLFAGDPARALAQARRIASHPPLGVAYFSWDSIAEAPALRDALAGAAGVAAPPAVGAPAPPGAAP
jgi:uncharacterized lipoprotein YddW (UPF0748 family)